MTQPIIHRAMTADDVPAVEAIERQVQSHPWTRNQFIESVQAHRCSVAVESKTLQIVGFCIMQPVLDEANLLLMAVLPAVQGRGIGYSLLEYAINQLSAECQQIFLEVREHNAAAIALYQKSDFHQIDKRKNYYPLSNGEREDAIIMVRSLQPFNFSATD